VNTQTSSYVIYIKLPTLRQGKYLEYVLVYPVDTAVESCKKTPEFLEESTLSGAKKHPDLDGDFMTPKCYYICQISRLMKALNLKY
jgi:hypothetical protein